MKDRQWLPFQWFPQRRFDPNFPLAFWFAGLWFYLKSFLYLCYIYMLGLEPPPYSTDVVFEIVYFAVTMVPALLLGLALWNEKKRGRNTGHNFSHGRYPCPPVPCDTAGTGGIPRFRPHTRPRIREPCAECSCLGVAFWPSIR